MRTILAFTTLVALTGAASAHAFLQSAAPAAGENLHGAPAKIVLHFSEPLEQAFSGITVTDAAGHDEAAGAITVDGTQMDLPLKPLAAGRYRVSWHAVSVDTHRTEGKYNFLVLP
jgi:methionine-rich copper-binding protein CopC